MNEVEKYGMFAVVAVAALIAAIAWTTTDESVSAQAVPVAGHPLSLSFGSKVGAPSGDEPAGAAARAPARNQPAAKRNTAKPAAAQPKAHARKGSGRPSGRKLPVVKHIRPFIQSGTGFEADELPVAYPGEHAYQPGHEAAPTHRRVTHVISDGETLSEIAKTYLGSPNRWQALIDLNPGIDPLTLQPGRSIVVKAGAATPDRAGSKTRAPAKATATSRSGAVPGAERIHVVKAGETLGQIAMDELGSMRFTDKLFELNRDILSSPDAVSIGQRLRIPAR